MPRDLYVAGEVSGSARLWRVTDAGAMTRLTGSNLPELDGLTEHDGLLYGVEPVNRFVGSSFITSRLWVVTISGNTFTVASRGALPNQANVQPVGALVSHGGRLLFVNRTGHIWNINPANPSDESGAFGRIADTTGVARIQAAASVGGTLYALAVDPNPDDLGSIALGSNSAVYTRIGALSGGAASSLTGMTEHFGALIGTSPSPASSTAINRALWTINRSNPGASTRVSYSGAESGAEASAIASHDPKPRRIGNTRIRARYLGATRLRNRYRGSTRL